MTERSLLADAVETFFSERCTPDDVAAIEAGRDPSSLWTEVEELGLTLASVPEEAGGPGGSLIDALTVLRAAGRHAVPLPLAETDMLAGWVLANAGLPVGVGPTTVAPVRPVDRLRISPENARARVSGRALRVPWASTAARIVLLAHDDQDRLFAALVEPGAFKVVPHRNLAGESRDTVELFDVKVDAFARVHVALDELHLRGALSRAVLMLGALERARDLAVSYSQDRVQFGRPIARFQAVQHLLAQLARDVAVTRAAVELAVSAAVEDVNDAWLEIAAAKVVAGRAAGSVSAQVHQVHGAIGVTKEYSLSILTRRLWSWRDEFGTEAEWSQRIGEASWRAPGGVWGLVTSGRLPMELARTA
jgi:acyl-CoA dehydrogenase